MTALTLIVTTRHLIRSENVLLPSLLIKYVDQEHWIYNSLQFCRFFAEISDECRERKSPAPLEL